jgi:hypothetical protein
MICVHSVRDNRYPLGRYAVRLDKMRRDILADRADIISPSGHILFYRRRGKFGVRGGHKRDLQAARYALSDKRRSPRVRVNNVKALAPDKSAKPEIINRSAHNAASKKPNFYMSHAARRKLARKLAPR